MQITTSRILVQEDEDTVHIFLKEQAEQPFNNPDIFSSPYWHREPEQTSALKEPYQPKTPRQLWEVYRSHNLIDFKDHPGGKASIWFLLTQLFPTATIYSLLLALTQVVGCGLHCGYLHLNESLFYSPKAYCSFGNMEYYWLFHTGGLKTGIHTKVIKTY